MKLSKKSIAFFLCFTLLISLVIPGKLMKVKAEGYARLSVGFEDGYNASGGTIEYKNEMGEWILVNEGISNVNAVAVRVNITEGYSFSNWTALRADGADILGNGDVREAIFSQDGYVLAEGMNYEFEHVDFVGGGQEPGPGPEPGQDEFSGIVYFVWEGENDSLCTHRISLFDEELIGDMNYVPVSEVKDDISGEQFKTDNENYYFVWEEKIEEVLKFSLWSEFVEYINTDEFIFRSITVNPCGAENGNATVCTNGDRTFRLTIYDESIFEGISFSANEDEYTYFPLFWDAMFFNSTIDISGTTPENPAICETFLDEPFISFKGAEKSISAITDVKALNVPEGAVLISGDSNSGYKVEFASNFFDKVVFEISTTNETYYIKIVRTAIQAFDNFGPGMSETPTITAQVFYDSNDSYDDYEVYATIYNKDGSQSVKKAEVTEISYDGLGNPMPEGTYETEGGKNLKLAHYSVEVTEDTVGVAYNVVKSGAFSGDTFGGSYLGSGEGAYYDIESRDILY